MTPQRYLCGATPVDAVQVPDDLGGVMAIADWIHTNGGRLTDPMATFDCAFRLYLADGTTTQPVRVGDWVVRFPSGSREFHRYTADTFAEAFKA